MLRTRSMNVSMLLKTALLATLLFAHLSADEVKENLSCDDSYNLCTEKCERSDNPPASCFNECDDKYDQCLAAAEESAKKQD